MLKGSKPTRWQIGVSCRSTDVAVSSDSLINSSFHYYPYPHLCPHGRNLRTLMERNILENTHRLLRRPLPLSLSQMSTFCPYLRCLSHPPTNRYPKQVRLGRGEYPSLLHPYLYTRLAFTFTRNGLFVFAAPEQSAKEICFLLV